MLQVDPGSIANWIDQDLLKAFRTPGGHRRVSVEDLICFLRNHKMPIPEELRNSPVRILVVDDEPTVTQMISQAIRSAHEEYEVIEAHDGFRAGTLAATLRPEVVILDLQMPGMDGYDICRLIKSHENTRHTEILAMTANPSPEDEKRVIECGARACLRKPLDMTALSSAVEAAL
jgi:CheY-like chemotaxis protein